MAPQNSTLLHENFELTSELGRFSPILPLNEKNSNDETLRQRKSISSRSLNIEEDNEIPIWICGEPRFISGITSATTCHELIQALIDDELHDKKNEGKVDVAVSRDLNDYVITERWRDVEQALPGEIKILPIWQAWSTARNEIKFKLKINKNKVGHDSEYRKPSKDSKSKKRRFGMLSKLVRRLIRQSETIHDHLSVISGNNLEKSIDVKSHNQLYDQRMMANFLKDSNASSTDYQAANIYVNPYIREPNPIDYHNNDELFLMIDHDDDDDRDSGVHVEYGQYILNKKCNASMRAKLSRMEEVKHTIFDYQETPMRKLYSKTQMDKIRQNNLNSRLMKTDIEFPKNLAEIQKSTRRYDIIRVEILSRMSDVSKLLKKENELIGILSTRCAQYRAQNEMYTAQIGLEMQIDEVQANLSFFAKEIIQNETKLFEIKMDIEQKHGILRNLYRMLKEEETVCERDENKLLFDKVFTVEKMNENFQKHRSSQETEICFVDNIYEFCDNNNSMIV